MFAVDDIDASLPACRSVAPNSTGEVPQYEDKDRPCFFRGPEGLVALDDELGQLDLPGAGVEPTRPLRDPGF